MARPARYILIINSTIVVCALAFVAAVVLGVVR